MMRPYRIYRDIYMIGSSDISHPYDCCVYLVDAGELVLIDAGAGESFSRLIDNMVALDFKPEKLSSLIVTHAHIDHVGAAGEIQRERQIPFILHQKEESVLHSVPGMSRMMGVDADDLPTIDEYIDPEKTYQFGDCSFSILETPGHTPGGVCFLFNDHVFVGDTLFAGGIGRTDFSGASHEQLLESIRTKLFTLDERIVVHTGHGAVTMIGREKMSNPFFV